MKHKIQGFEFNDKRFYPPITVKRECPSCKQELLVNLAGDTSPMSYPVTEQASQVYFICNHCEADLELDVTLSLSAEIGEKVRIQ